MKKTTTLCIFTSLCLVQGVFADAITGVHDSKEMEFIFKNITKIAVGDVDITGNSEKYDLLEGEVWELLENKFEEKGFYSEYDDDDTPSPPLLDISIKARNNMVLVEAQLNDAAVFINPWVFIHGSIWKNQVLLSEDDGLDMKQAILSSIDNFADQVLNMYFYYKSK